MLVEDDQDHSELISRLLIEAGHKVTVSEAGRLGLREFFAAPPDLVLLDIRMPVMDGWTLLQRIREVSEIPVIMLTVLDQESQKIQGLRSGADDFLVKPVGGPELLARIDAVVRRKSADKEIYEDYHDSLLSIDYLRHEVQVRSQAVQLSAGEFRLLSALVQNRDTVMSTLRLRELCWPDRKISPESVRVYINYLRKKLEEDPADPQLLETVRGYGYRYRRHDGRE